MVSFVMNIAGLDQAEGSQLEPIISYPQSDGKRNGLMEYACGPYDTSYGTASAGYVASTASYGTPSTAYGTSTSYANYYPGGLNVDFAPYSRMPYLPYVDMSHKRFPPDRQLEPKPRLAKDEVQLLEDCFKQTPKPPSSVKRQLADQMRVEVARINNWFQNRRAKAKQERNLEKYQACREATARDANSSPSQDQQTVSVQEHFPQSNQQAPLQPCVVAFGASASPEAEKEPSESRGDISEPSVDESPAFNAGDVNPSCAADSADPIDACMTTVAPTDANAPIFDPHGIPTFSNPQDVPAFDCLFSSAPATQPFQVTIDSQNTHLSMAHDSGVPSEGASENSAQETSRSEATSPAVMSSPPPPTEFKPPPPAANIAHRRNRRPLGLVPSYLSQPALRTAAGDVPRKPDTDSPIRRIASAMGFAPSRVVKQSSGPRSPMYSEKKQNALLQSLQGARSPNLPGALINATPGPPTPRTPLFLGQKGLRESSTSSASDDETRPFAFHMARYTRNLDDPLIKTPPGSPGVDNFQEGLYMSNATDRSINYMSTHDTPVFTPCGQGSGRFPPELTADLQNPLRGPDYVSSGVPSQPATPSFPPLFTGGACFGQSSGNSEYNWPNSSVSHTPLTRSPQQGSAGKTFQFTPNMTPQSFRGSR